ncbi:hypothetical protein [Pseudomonas sp. AB12(2023)]|uniref:hypothetical protein n=1 Tax=Pseudomonas sp. AB12(2023) TaxID=3048597 RepID=UPI002B2316A9|nr:hypothetical protein [Pseudomonas sp. AB12(2023)]MEB0222092.1 hypothetical protein [Pseudomonas sp. AB12(2023)]MEB0222107.1 hypothetical protein [Pseudomonas sp. AB12(2023)]
MPMIDSDTFKAELDAANLAREALIDHQILPKPYDRDWHQAESARLLEAYQAATNSLAHQMKKVVELAETVALIG